MRKKLCTLYKLWFLGSSMVERRYFPLVGISPPPSEHLLSGLEFVPSLVEVLLSSMWVFPLYLC
jgi:hypothetical protein